MNVLCTFYVTSFTLWWCLSQNYTKWN